MNIEIVFDKIAKLIKKAQKPDELEAIIDNSGVLDSTEGTIEEKVEQLVEKTEHYDSFWDAFQSNGTRTNYEYAFFNKGWNNDTFDPKYDMVISYCTSMFRSCGEIDIIQKLKNNNITFDTSHTTNMSYLFYSGDITTAPTIVIPTKIKSGAHMFFGCKKLHTIEKIVYHSEYDSTNNFADCIELQNIVVEGEIGKRFNIANSSKLTLESAKSILLALYNYSGTDSEFVNTITLSTQTVALLEADGNTAPNGMAWAEYVGSIGWNM